MKNLFSVVFAVSVLGLLISAGAFSRGGASTLSETALANIEALASGESGTGEKDDCYHTISDRSDDPHAGWIFLKYCGTCEAIKCKMAYDPDHCY